MTRCKARIEGKYIFKACFYFIKARGSLKFSKNMCFLGSNHDNVLLTEKETRKKKKKN